jgi:hypothetical protein
LALIDAPELGALFGREGVNRNLCAGEQGADLGQVPTELVERTRDAGVSLLDGLPQRLDLCLNAPLA